MGSTARDEKKVNERSPLSALVPQPLHFEYRAAHSLKKCLGESIASLVLKHAFGKNMMVKGKDTRGCASNNSDFNRTSYVQPHNNNDRFTQMLYTCAMLLLRQAPTTNVANVAQVTSDFPWRNSYSGRAIADIAQLRIIDWFHPAVIIIIVYNLNGLP
ncbi:hypothetical protein PoB_004858500 [Plakobranchus ocellatus]|uniref:Uncharacterized protein n=1 Tax=Plakobranchus ocellatus TaxID=259542 RepID=A0AAV4BSK1_9GAST|nr:hypothetical protein PoB_004858500 [Plakobranchus ocellatus]